MAKITRHGGPTDGAVSSGRVRVLLPGVAQVIRGERGPELVDLPEGTRIGGFLPPQGDEVDLDEEGPCPGSSSQTSPAKPPKSAGPEMPSRRQRARTTGVRSKNTAASATAPTATTSGPATGA